MPGGCLLAGLVLALLSLLPGARAGAPAAQTLRPPVAHAEVLLRPADRVRADPSALTVTTLERGAPAHVPYALLPTALALVAAVGLLVRRSRRTDRSARPARGVPTGRSPPVRLRAA